MISHCIKGIVFVNTYCKWWNKKRFIFTCLRCRCYKSYEIIFYALFFCGYLFCLITGLYRNARTQTVIRCLQGNTKFYFYTQTVSYFFTAKYKIFTAWKVFKYGVFSGPYFPVFGLNTEINSVKSPYSVRVQEYRDQKKLCIWTLFTQCLKTVLKRPSEFFTQTYSQISIHLFSTKNKI